MLSLLQGKLGLNEKVIEDLNKLEDEKFIQEFINEPEHYKFKHILTREVSYNTILKSNKKFYIMQSRKLLKSISQIQ